MRVSRYAILKGPARIMVADGELRIGGKSFIGGEGLDVPAGSSALASGTCTLNADIEGGGNVQLLEESAIPHDWDESRQALLDAGGGVAMVIGENDAGKTTLTTYLANELLAEGITVSIVDSDIGQSDIGPPTTVALGEPREPFPMLHTIKEEAMYFVGSISPVGHMLPLLVGVDKMLAKAKGKAVLINTTGLVRGAGMALKTHKIELLDPDFILALERGDELEELLGPFHHKRILRLGVSKMARARTQHERRAQRINAMRKYFGGARRLRVDSRVITFAGAYRGGGIQEGRLCGLADRENEFLGLGILGRVHGTEVEIYTPIKGGLLESVRLVRMGSVAVDVKTFNIRAPDEKWGER